MANDVKIRLSVDGTAEVVSGLDRVGANLGTLGNATQSATRALKDFALVAASGLSVRAFVQAADAATILNNQLKLATGSASAAAKAYESLFAIAQRSRVSFTELGSTFATISRAGEALGLSQQRLLGVTEAISNAVAVSGGSAESARAALVQLGQGLSAGVLRGEELNSVMEQTPRLARALADGLGVTTGELRKLGEQGKITADAVIQALESQSGVLKGELAGSIVTVGQAWTQLENASVKAVGEMDKATGISQTMAGALQGVATAVSSVGQAFKENKESIDIAMGTMAGAATAAGLLAVAANIGKIRVAVLGLTAALASNPIGLALVGIGAGVGGLLAYVDNVKSSADGIKSQIKELERLNAQAAASPHDAILNANVATRTKKIRELTAALQEMEKAQRADAASIGSVGSGDTALRRELARQDALKTPDKAAMEAAKKEFEAQRKLIAELSGLSGDFSQDWARLNTIFASGKLNVDQLTAAQAVLLSKQPAIREEVQQQEQAQKAATKAQQDYLDAVAKSLEQGARENAALQEKNESLRLHNQEIGLTDAALAELVDTRLAHVVALEEERAEMLLLNGGTMDEVALITRRIDLLKDERRLRSEGMAKQIDADRAAEAAKAAEKAQDEWRKAAEKIEDSITDALMRGFESGKGFAENLRDTVVNMFKTMVLRPVVEFGVRGALSAVGLGSLSGAANAASTLGGLGNLAGMASTMTSVASAFGGALTTGFTMALNGGLGLALEGGAAMLGSATGVSSALAGIGQLAGALGPLAIGLAALPAIGGMFDGGREYTTGGGITGRFSGDTFAGRNYQTWRNDGSSGFFGIGASGSSSGTNYSAMDSTMQQTLGTVYGALLEQTAQYVKALGGNAETITGYQRDITLALGADAQANQQAIDGLFKGIADELAALALAGSNYAKSGETASATLARLGTSITQVNAWLSMLRQRTYQVGLAGADTASKLADLFGGLSGAGTAMQAYYDGFFTAAEKASNATESMTAALAQYGISLPASKEQYRLLTESIDLTTASGRKAYAALITLAPEYAKAADYAEQAAKDQAAAAKESAQQILAQYHSIRISVPALDTAALVNSVSSANSVVAGFSLAPVTDDIQAALNSITIPPLDTTALQKSMSTASGLLGSMDLSGFTGAVKDMAGTANAVNFSQFSVAVQSLGTTAASVNFAPFADNLRGLSSGLFDAAGRSVNMLDAINSMGIGLYDARGKAIDARDAQARLSQTLYEVWSASNGFTTSIAQMNSAIGNTDLAGFTGAVKDMAGTANAVNFGQFSTAIQSLGTSAASVNFAPFAENLRGLSSGLFDASGNSISLNDAISSMGFGLRSATGEALSAEVANNQLAKKLAEVYIASGHFSMGLTEMYRVMGDPSSGFVYYAQTTGRIVDQSVRNTQNMVGVLQNQIDTLKSTTSGIDFAGISTKLTGELSKFNPAVVVNVLEVAFTNMAERLKTTLDNITSERVAVREAAIQILDPKPRDLAQIAADSVGINAGLPSRAALDAADKGLSAAQSLVNQRNGQLKTYQEMQAGVEASLKDSNAAAATFKAETLQKIDRFHALADAYGTHNQGMLMSSVWGANTDYLNDDAYRYNAASNRLNPFVAYGGRSWNNTYYADTAGMANNPEYQALRNYLANANDTFAAYERQQAGLNRSIASWASTVEGAKSQVADAKSQQTAAEAAAAKATLAYTAAMEKFSMDASKAVTKLGRLREETVKYYEEQKRLAELMQTAAAGLRGTIADYRYSQLSPEKQAAQLQSQFATAYSMALSTQGNGDLLAGYADKINALLPSLIDKLTETGQGGLIGNYLSQAEAVAKALEDNAPKNYQADSLAMLGQIDGTLATLEANTLTAERVITAAINASADKTADGLRAVVRALGGTPAFATGGYHSGGLRLVGENGPELEVTGPSRIFNGAQMRRMLGGGGESLSAAELRALREEVAALRRENMAGHAATASNTGQATRLLTRFEIDGMPVKNTLDGPLTTVAA